MADIERRFLQQFVYYIILNEKTSLEELEQKEFVERIRISKQLEERGKLITREFIPEKKAPIQEETPVPAPIKQRKPIITETKLDPLLNDLSVKVIIVHNGHVRIKRASGGFEDVEFLIASRDERAIIDKFSIETKIPAVQGVFRAKLEDLTINAIKLDTISPRFILIRSAESAAQTANSGMPIMN